MVAIFCLSSFGKFSFICLSKHTNANTDKHFYTNKYANTNKHAYTNKYGNSDKYGNAFANKHPHTNSN